MERDLMDSLCNVVIFVRNGCISNSILNIKIISEGSIMPETLY